MNSNVRSFIILCVNICVSLIYMVAIYFFINKTLGISSLLDYIMNIVKSKSLAIILITACLGTPLAFLLKLINKKL